MILFLTGCIYHHTVTGYGTRSQHAECRHDATDHTPNEPTTTHWFGKIYILATIGAGPNHGCKDGLDPLLHFLRAGQQLLNLDLILPLHQHVYETLYSMISVRTKIHRQLGQDSNPRPPAYLTSPPLSLPDDDLPARSCLWIFFLTDTRSQTYSASNKHQCRAKIKSIIFHLTQEFQQLRLFQWNSLFFIGCSRTRNIKASCNITLDKNL